MKSISLQKKFFLFSVISAVSVFVLAGVAYTTIGKLIAASQESKTANQLIQNHMQGDMMHDAIRGDVLHGILAYKDQNSATLETAAKDLTEHSAEFTQKVNENLALPLPKNMHDLIADLAPKLSDYQQKAHLVISNLDTQDFSRVYDEFTQSFEAMELAQSQVSDAIDAWSAHITAEGTKVAEHSRHIILISSVITMLLAASIPLYARLSLFKPLQLIIGDMKRVVAGDLNVNEALAERGDEIGLIANALNVFKDNIIENKRLEQLQKQAESNAQEERKRMMEQLANDFEADVRNVILAVSSAAAELQNVSENMQKSVAGVGQQSEAVSLISQRAASNVENVSAAVEEMSASVKEIASQINKSSGLVGETVARTAQADNTTHVLSDAVAQISGILQLIQDIAGQINLLALNATIESARAGEAGKGFAVVASEVKNLASQTTKATEEIAKQIENVQHASNEVVEVLKQIQDGISNVNQYSSGIASAVEEQSAAAREISANMQHAALGVQDITGNITGINKSAQEADITAKEVLGAAQSMSRQSDMLKQQISNFMSKIRA